MEVSRRITIGNCPTPACGERIRVSVGRFTGGINDRGGFVIKCAKCQKLSHYPVLNPDDASFVESGGQVIDKWDSEVDGDRENVLAEHGLSEADMLSDPLLYIPSQEPDDPLFELADRPIYACLDCGTNIEPAAHAALDHALDAVNHALGNFMGPYLKGYTPQIAAVEVVLDVQCSCSSHRVSFFRDFLERDDFAQKALDFIFAGPEDPTMLREIDGIYTRNECIAIFKKVLLRWRARHKVVMLVVPFIGFDYPNREDDKISLWNMVVGYTNPNRTLMVTRRRTYNSFKATAGKKGFDLDVLKKYGILARLLETLDEKKALFKTESHAKFYAAIGPETTELLSGSFNIHSGEYVENLVFSTHQTASFVKRYLLPLGVLPSPITEIATKMDVVRFTVADGQVVNTSCKKV